MYQALYRKWRPMTFDDVVSQPHITTTLRNQIKSGKIAHAYLFTGSRGTGKTTCARIFAKAVNCLSSHDGAPCLQCDICNEMDNQTLNDIIEIDAASNTGVDDMRELRESTAYTPEKCKYKVYIIDEVHMLSVNAFNALLKILEEPPEHVKFIFATTELHKVPVTILSRCQVFNFRRIRPEDIEERIKYIASQEDFTLTDDAAALIAKLADGGMRDALSLLDQCIAYSKDVSISTVSAAAGIAGRDYLFELLDCFADKNAPKAISVIGKLYDDSKDMQRLIDELISQMRNVMLAKTVSDNSIFACLPDEIEKLRQLSEKLSMERVLYMLRTLQDCAERLPRVSAKRIEIEMCTIKLCRDEESKSQASAPVDSTELSAIMNRLAKLEKAVANGVRVDNAKQEKQPEPLIEPDQSPLSEPKMDLTKINPDDLKPLDCWLDIIERIGERDASMAGFLHGSTAFVYETLLFITVDNDFFLKMFKQTSCGKVIAEVMLDYFGKHFAIRVRSAKNVVPGDDSNPLSKLLAKAKNSDIAVDIK